MTHDMPLSVSVTNKDMNNQAFCRFSPCFSDFSTFSTFPSGILLILSVPEKLVSFAEELSPSWTPRSRVSMLHSPNPPGWWTGTSTADQPSFTGHNVPDHTTTVKTLFGPSPIPSIESRDHPLRTGFQNTVGPDSYRTSSGSIIAPSVVWNSSAVLGNPAIKASSINRRPGSRMNQPVMASGKQKVSKDSGVAPAALRLQRTEDFQPRSINDLEQVRSTGPDITQGMSVAEPNNPSYPSSSMMSLWLSIPAMAPRKSLRQHAHAITLRDVGTPKDHTLVGNVSVSPSESQAPSLFTYFPHNTTKNSKTNNVILPTVAASISVNSSSAKTIGGTNMPANVTGDAFSSQSSVTDAITGSVNGQSLGTSPNTPPRINDLSTSELLSRTNMSRSPNTPGRNQSHPDVNTANPDTICMTKMDIVWVVLAITVPVSSCCEYLPLHDHQSPHSVPVLVFVATQHIILGY